MSNPRRFRSRIPTPRIPIPPPAYNNTPAPHSFAPYADLPPPYSYSAPNHLANDHRNATQGDSSPSHHNSPGQIHNDLPPSVDYRFPQDITSADEFYMSRWHGWENWKQWTEMEDLNERVFGPRGMEQRTLSSQLSPPPFFPETHQTPQSQGLNPSEHPATQPASTDSPTRAPDLPLTPNFSFSSTTYYGGVSHFTSPPFLPQGAPTIPSWRLDIVSRRPRHPTSAASPLSGPPGSPLTTAPRPLLLPTHVSVPIPALDLNGSAAQLQTQTLHPIPALYEHPAIFSHRPDLLPSQPLPQRRPVSPHSPHRVPRGDMSRIGSLGRAAPAPAPATNPQVRTSSTPDSEAPMPINGNPTAHTSALPPHAPLHRTQPYMHPDYTYPVATGGLGWHGGLGFGLLPQNPTEAEVQAHNAWVVASVTERVHRQVAEIGRQATRASEGLRRTWAVEEAAASAVRAARLAEMEAVRLRDPGIVAVLESHERAPGIVRRGGRRENGGNGDNSTTSSNSDNNTPVPVLGPANNGAGSMAAERLGTGGLGDGGPRHGRPIERRRDRASSPAVLGNGKARPHSS